MQLSQKVAVVTGAACGVGQALVLLLADKGCHLAICDEDDEGLRESAAFANARGVHVSEYRVQVSERAQVQEFAEQCIHRHGHVDIVIHAAGAVLDGPLCDTSSEALRRDLDVNLWGVIHGCQAFLPHLLTRPRAHLANVSTVHGILAGARGGAAATSHAAVTGYSRALGSELAGGPVVVSQLASGPGSALAGARWPGGSAEAWAARRIVRSIVRGESKITLGAEARVLELATRVVPGRLSRLRGATSG